MRASCRCSYAQRRRSNAERRAKICRALPLGLTTCARGSGGHEARLTSMSDEQFHEFHLDGKQMVFLFMASTVVAVVIFLCGVMVGRGVRASRVDPVVDARGRDKASEVDSAEPPPDVDPSQASPNIPNEFSYRPAASERLASPGAHSPRPLPSRPETSRRRRLFRKSLHRRRSRSPGRTRRAG